MLRLSSSALLLLLGAAAFVSSAKKEPPQSTLFDGIEVPPLLELTPDNFIETVESTKHMFIKHYSPYCSHCIDFAPTFQTVYEFYYVSRPAGPDPANTSNFTQFYDFRFAMVDCVAYYDMCQQHHVKSYPSSILYVDGRQVETLKGAKTVEQLSSVIEKALEEARPGSRPDHLVLPRPKDQQSPSPTAKLGSDSTKQGATAVVGKKEQSDDSSTKAAGAGTTPEVPASLREHQQQQQLGLTPAAAEPRAPANIRGESEPLTAETFRSRVGRTRDPWLIKFYAPWCHHCKALAPQWQHMAKQMKDRLNVGEVNCDRERALCKELKVAGYPSIRLYRGAENVEYEGLRGLGDLVRYAERAVDLAGSVPDVDADGFRALEATEDVIFVYFYDHATTTEDLRALDRLPLHLMGRARIVKTTDRALCDRFKVTSWPRLLVSREGRPTYYTPLTPAEMRNVPMLLGWVRSAWLPIVPELTAATAREIMDGKIVVLAVLDRSGAGSDRFAAARREIKSAAVEWLDRQVQELQLERNRLRDAKQLRIDEAEDRNDQRALRNAKNIRISMDMSDRREVAFAWVDGVFWQRWIKTTYGIDVRDGERVIINDEDNRRYWDTTMTGDRILVSRTAMTETLDKLVANPNAIRPKLTISAFSKIFFDIRMFYVEHTYLAVIGTIGSVYLVVQWLRRRGGGGGGSHADLHRLLDDGGISGAGGVLPGGGGSGKHD